MKRRWYLQYWAPPLLIVPCTQHRRIDRHRYGWHKRSDFDSSLHEGRLFLYACSSTMIRYKLRFIAYHLHGSPQANDKTLCYNPKCFLRYTKYFMCAMFLWLRSWRCVWGESYKKPKVPIWILTLKSQIVKSAPCRSVRTRGSLLLSYSIIWSGRFGFTELKLCGLPPFWFCMCQDVHHVACMQLLTDVIFVFVQMQETVW